MTPRYEGVDAGPPFRTARRTPRARDEGFEAHLELSGEGRARDAETAILGFSALLTRLGPDARRLWEGATKRDFNIGVQGGTQPHAFDFALLPQTLATVAALRARSVMTVYAAGTAASNGERGGATR